MRVNIEPEQFRWERPWSHAAQMAATSATEESLLKVKLITGWPMSEPLPLLQEVSFMIFMF